MARPTIMTEDMVNKLEEAFLMGMSDREACLYANISTQTLYNYGNKNPEFLERKEMLKERPKMRAKMNVSRDIDKGNVKTSVWYLEHKANDEFSTKQTTELAGGVDVALGDKRSIMEERLKELRNEHES